MGQRLRELPQAIANIDQAFKLSLRVSDIGRWHWLKSWTFNSMGRYPEAIREGKAAFDNGFSSRAVYVHLAVAYAWADSMSQRNIF